MRSGWKPPCNRCPRSALRTFRCSTISTGRSRRTMAGLGPTCSEATTSSWRPTTRRMIRCRGCSTSRAGAASSPTRPSKPCCGSCGYERRGWRSRLAAMLDMKHVYDVVVLGAGGAGCAAAIEARQLTASLVLVTRRTLKDSKTYQAQGGIQAAFGRDDSPDKHCQDTLRTGQYANDPKL